MGIRRGALCVRGQRLIGRACTVVDCSNTVEVIPVLNLRPRRMLRGHLSKISCLHWADDKQRLVSASHDGRVIVWNAFTQQKEHLITLKSPWVMACAFAPGARAVACGGLDNICTVYSLGTKEPRAELIGHEGYISACRFLSRSRIATSSGDMSCKLWDVEAAKCLTTFTGHKGDVTTYGVCGRVSLCGWGWVMARLRRQ